MSMDASMHQFSLHRFMLAKVKFPDLSIAGQRRLASRRVPVLRETERP